MKTFYLVKYYLSQGMVESRAKEQREGSKFIHVFWRNGCSAVVPEKDGSFDKAKALQLAKALVEKQKKSTAKKMQKLEKLEAELEKELEAIA